MRTAGVDLAAEPKGTALAIIDWRAEHAELVELRVGITDVDIVDAAAGVSRMGIDCAFGWPDDFLTFITAHAAGLRVDRSIDSGMDWRRRLAYRETDRDTRNFTGRWPLSVATDRLGLTAMHCAALLDLIGERFGTVDRSGSGLAAEVYPGATLRLWGFSTTGYKAEASVRAALMDAITNRAPWLDLSAFRDLMLSSDDAFDAVIASLGARALALGLTRPPPPESLAQARREGWIALPTGQLEDLDPGNTALQ